MDPLQIPVNKLMNPSPLNEPEHYTAEVNLNDHDQPSNG